MKGNKKWYWIIGLLIVGVLIYLYLKKKKQQKEELPALGEVTENAETGETEVKLDPAILTKNTGSYMQNDEIALSPASGFAVLS